MLDSPVAKRSVGGASGLSLGFSRLTLNFRESLLKAFGDLEVTPAEHLGHLVKLGWVNDSLSRLSLTALGRALLSSAEIADSAETEGAVIVLDSEDQFAYAKLIGYLNQAGEGLLVDPYFRLPQFMEILSATSIGRVLISKQYKNSREARGELMIALTSTTLPRKIEIRATSDESLHDRLIVGDSGKVWLLGASLNSVGHVNTALIPLPMAGETALRELAERLWSEAESLELPAAVAAVT